MRITRIELTATDLDEVASFYGNTLELPTRRTAESVEVTVGWSTIGFTTGEPRAGDIHIAFTIPRNQIDEARAWLTARTALSVVDGIEVLVLDSEPWRSKSLYFRGPDGIVLELITRANLGGDSTSEFSGRSLLNISEVGLATTDVPAAAAELLSRFGIKPFGDGGDEFRPIGDDEGLFILVAEGRAWFTAPDARAQGGPAITRIEAAPGRVERPGWTVTA